MAVPVTRSPMVQLMDIADPLAIPPWVEMIVGSGDWDNAVESGKQNSRGKMVFIGKKIKVV